MGKFCSRTPRPNSFAPQGVRRRVGASCALPTRHSLWRIKGTWSSWFMRAPIRTSLGTSRSSVQRTACSVCWNKTDRRLRKQDRRITRRPRPRSGSRHIQELARTGCDITLTLLSARTAPKATRSMRSVLGLWLHEIVACGWNRRRTDLPAAAKLGHSMFL